jgi:hypothetical protein
MISSEEQRLMDIVSRMEFVPIDDPLIDFKLKRKIRDLSDKNARIEKYQECWEKCNCKKKS